LKFEHKYGVIVACDVTSLDELENLVEETHGVEGITGYKIGKLLGLRFGLRDVSETIRKFTDKPIIYDHQKAGTDIPYIGGKYAELLDELDVDAGIIFPQAGPETEEAYVEALIEKGVEPIVGGEMTHPGYLEKEGGYLRNNAPEEMYRKGAEAGAKTFVVPGNRKDALRKWTELISKKVDDPILTSPGFGRQGGDVKEGIEVVRKANKDAGFQAIIGSGIYKQPVSEDAKYPSFKSPEKAAKFFAKQALEYGD